MPRSDSELHAWDIYAKELQPLGYGYPLWHPEPSPEHGEVQLGDVGCVRNGRFEFLFNCMCAADEPINARGVPRHFRVFEPPSDPVTTPNVIMDPLLLAGSARTTDVDGGASFRYVCLVSARFPTQAHPYVVYSAGSVAHANGKSTYHQEKQTGAYLALKRPPLQTVLHGAGAITAYMCTHYQDWYRFAVQTRGLKVDVQDLLFVSGFVKTSVWALGAFKDARSAADFKLDGGAMFTPAISLAANAGFSKSERSLAPAPRLRSGPQERLSLKEDVLCGTPNDQCLFLQYYHLKPRVPIVNWFMRVERPYGIQTMSLEVKPVYRRSYDGENVQDPSDDDSAPSQDSEPELDSPLTPNGGSSVEEDALDFILQVRRIAADPGVGYRPVC